MTETPSPAARLERDRLLRRAQRIERVLAALQDRAAYVRSADGAPPLTTAIDDRALERGRLRPRVPGLPDAPDRRASGHPRTDRVRRFPATR